MQRTWLITGAASGMGRELASQLARRGDRLVLWDRDEERLTRVVSLLGPAVLHHETVDVVSPEETREAAQRVANLSVAITRAIHCAGVIRVGAALSVPPHDYRTLMEVNYLGTVNVTRALVPVLMQAAGKRERALLALIASVAGLRAIPGLAGYSASNFAIIGYAQALRDELHGEPIDLRVICPPAMDTPMLRNLGELPQAYRLAPPQQVEKVAAALLERVEGKSFLELLDLRSKLMWGVQRAMPGGLDWALRRAKGR